RTSRQRIRRRSRLSWAAPGVGAAQFTSRALRREMSSSESAAEAYVHLVVEVAVPRYRLRYGVYLEVAEADEPERSVPNASPQVERVVPDVVGNAERQDVRCVERAEP